MVFSFPLICVSLDEITILTAHFLYFSSALRTVVCVCVADGLIEGVKTVGRLLNGRHLHRQQDVLGVSETR